MLELLGLPAAHSEADLHPSLLAKLRQRLIALGRDFCFVGSEFPVQVGALSLRPICSSRRQDGSRLHLGSAVRPGPDKDAFAQRKFLCG